MAPSTKKKAVQTPPHKGQTAPRIRTPAKAEGLEVEALASAPLPKLVHAVGDRIGLDYKLNASSVADKYIKDRNEESQNRLRMGAHVGTAYYYLSESHTRSDQQTPIKDRCRLSRNPLKLNSRIRRVLYKLSTEEKQQIQYATFEKVHALWQQYGAKTIADKDPQAVTRMDLHGCKLQCTASKNPTLIGAEGIVVQETRNTFYIIKSTNRLLTLPKRESIFEFQLGEKSFRIHGCNLLLTTQFRSKAKFKQKRCMTIV